MGPKTLRRTIRIAWVGLLTGLLLVANALSASAETLLMPDRDFLMTPTTEVVWGTTTLPNGSTYAFHFDDGSADATGTVSNNQSYLVVTHQFQNSGTLHATLTVQNGATTEVANVTLQVFNPASMTAEQLRGLNINRAIQDGLRYLWQAQSNRQGGFQTSNQTNWGGAHPQVWAALIVAAFQNHGYILPNNQTPATGVYQKYVVERGLNYLGVNLSTFSTSLQGSPATNEPCVGTDTNGNPIGPSPCTAFFLNDNPGYATSIAIQPFAGSQALQRKFASSGLNANIQGKSYGEVLQRLIIGLAWGQGDAPSLNGRGGWHYSFNDSTTDGSTIGWNMVALLDAAAAGATIPGFVQSEFAGFAFPRGINNDGTFDYSENGDKNTAGGVGPDMARAGVGLQAMFYAGDNTLVNAAKTSIINRWSGTALPGDYALTCGNYITTVPGNNKGCAYSMYNVFKGLKLQGIQTLPGIGRPAGPGAIPQDDWYADYQDWLVQHQHLPTNTAGGDWAYTNDANGMAWSCCAGPESAPDTAIAELILAPVALVLPDPTKFGTVGLSPASATNPVGTSHTVTAHASATNDAPVAGATVVFTVLSGPNAGQTGSAVTDSNGLASFTYNDTGGAGTDSIRASIGTLNSNTVQKIWASTCTDFGLTPGANLLSPMFPLDHGFRGVQITGVGPAVISKICQDEDPNFENIAAWAVDGQGIGTDTAGVRAERSGTRANPGNGRVYHIFFTAPRNNSCTGEVTVGVPLAAGGVAIDNGALFNSVTGGSCNNVGN